jgi:hypothetical protein
MLGIFTILLILAGVSAAFFYFFLKKKNERVPNGMSQRYETLRDLLREGKLPVSEKMHHHSLHFKIKADKELFSYSLSEVDGRLIVVWTLDSKIHGKRGKEWSFKIDYDQSRMFEEIKNDVSDYRKRLHVHN